MALRSGDYSLFGFEQRVAIERKSLADIFSSVGGQRKRFEKEVQRLAAMEYAAVVIEATLEECLAPQPYSQMNPKAVVNTLLAWSVKYRLAVFFAGNRRFGRAVTYRLLEKFFNYQQEKRSGQSK